MPGFSRAMQPAAGKPYVLMAGTATDVDAGLAQRMPGMLRSRFIVLTALIVAPWLTPLVYVETTVRIVAGALLGLHLLVALYVMRRPESRWSRRLAAVAVLADAVGCGVLLGAAVHVYGAGVPLAAVVLVMAFETGGWRLVRPAFAAVLCTAAATLWKGLGTPLILSPAFLFVSTLNVETRFAGAPAVAVKHPTLATILTVERAFGGELVESETLAFPTSLRVDTSFDGLPGVLTEDAVFVPALGLAILAICVGSGASLITAAPAAGPPAAAAG
jgi:hypothetical protein